MNLLLHPEAERDLFQAAMFYEQAGSPALAARFVREFKRLCALLAEQPGIGAARSGGRRGFAMSHFPFTVIYRADPATLHILVVKHDRRRPGFGGRRR